MLPVPKSKGVQCLSESSARLIYAIVIVNETSSVTVSRGRVLTAQYQGRCQKLSQNLHVFKLANVPEKQVGNAKGEVLRALAAVTARLRRGRDFFVLAFAVQVQNRLGEAGCADPVLLSRIASRTAESASPSNFFLFSG